jgi:hypothetical protein
MAEHIERCFNVSNGWFHSGKNDGTRPYDDIVTPIIDVAFRLEGFDVKDIYPYVNDVEQAYKSFIVRKYHPQWARNNQIDTFIDDVVESSIIYDLVLIKDVKRNPEVINLQDIAFCDQTDVLSGAIGIRHYSTPAELQEYKGKWNDEKIDEVITMAKASKKVSMANDQEAKTTDKNIEWFEVYGNFPETWYKEDGDPNKYVPQLHILNFYTTSEGKKQGITLWSGKDVKLTDRFKALKIDRIRSKGRACGRSIVERLFEPQVWQNYSGIKLKKMLDNAVNLLQTDSDEYGNKKITDLKENTVIKHEPGKPLTKIDMGIQNFSAVESYQDRMKNGAMMLGSASEAALGIAPASGTPFALQNLIVQQGEGIHEYRRGKIATFFADVLYPEWFIPDMVAEMNGGKKFSEDLSADELAKVADQIAKNVVNKHLKDIILKGGKPTPDMQKVLEDVVRKEFMKGGERQFFEVMKGELTDVPIKVFINVAGKQKNLAKDADKLSNIIMFALKAGVPLQTLSKPINELLEASGLSPIDFNLIPETPPPTQTQNTGQSVPSPIQANQLPTKQ